jgi:CheY-like chemotaxis protein
MSAGDRVLVVDDDDDIRELIEYLLAGEGFDVDVATDGLDALGRLEANTQVPMILLDMMMPNMDGETFLRALRSRPAMAGAPVVVISGNTAAREKARELHAVACLVKPFELDELLDLVRTFAPQKH